MSIDVAPAGHPTLAVNPVSSGLVGLAHVRDPQPMRLSLTQCRCASVVSRIRPTSRRTSPCFGRFNPEPAGCRGPRVTEIPDELFVAAQ